MNIYLSILILISTVSIQTKGSTFSTGASKPDKEPRNISQVCDRYKDKINELFSYTTICSNHENRYSWCATEGSGWDSCPRVKCRNIDPDENICHDQILWSSTSSSISIDFSRATAPQKHELLIILTSLDHLGRTAQCFVTRICRGRCSLIGRFYQNSCKNAPDPINIYEEGSKVVTFADLAQDTNQILYLMRVVDKDTIGSAVTILRLRTRPAVSHAPLNIAILHKSSTSIKLGWRPSTKSGNYGPPEGYQVTMNGGDRILNTITNYIVFDHLSQCRPYCFTIASFNKAGKSATSTAICTNTTIDFERVELSPMKEDFPVTRLVSWRYNNSNNCPVVFEVEYSVKNATNVFLLKTSAYYIQLNRAETDQIFSVKVRPTFDGNQGEHSSSQDFDTFRRPSVPSNIEISEISVTKLKLRWDPSIKSKLNGPADGYQITMTGSNTNLKKNTSTNDIVVDNLKECMKYCFVVASFNKVNMSSNSQSFCTSTATNFKKVELVSIISDSQNSRNVSWRYEDANGCNVIFEVQCFARNKNSFNSLYTTQHYIRFGELAEDQIYFVKVRPSFLNKTGNYSTTHDFHTYKIPDIPPIITIYEKVATRIKLKWTPAQRSDEYGLAQGYQITMTSEYISKILNTSTNEIVFDNLRQCTQHCFVVASFNMAGRSADSQRICASTETGFYRMHLLSITSYSLNTINISWQYYEVNHCAVVFEVHYTVKRENSPTIITTTSDRKLQLQQLESDQIYVVKVRPKHGVKYGSFSPSRQFHTFRKPVTPSDVSIVKTMPTSISLQWHKSSETYTYGRAQKYSITIYNSSTTSMHSTSMESYEFDNLRNLSNYCFTVVAHNLAGASNDSHPICGNTSTEDKFTQREREITNLKLQIKAKENLIQEYNDKEQGLLMEINKIKIEIRDKNVDLAKMKRELPKTQMNDFKRN